MAKYFFLFLMSTPLFLSAQCDQAVTPINGRMGYQSRGQHCEGFYRSLVSAQDLQIVHFTKGNLKYSSTDPEQITLSVPVKTEPSVNIRGMGIPRNLYYRMDAVLNSGQSFIWNTATVLLDNSSTKYSRLVGLLGYTESNGRRVYVPVKVNQSESQVLRIKFVASTTVKQLKWRLRGKTDYQPIRNGRTFTPGRTIPITLPSELASGDYTLEIIGKERDGVTDISEVIRIKI